MRRKVQQFTLMLLLVLAGFTVAQSQRNPVLEEFTGTWCQWCPCGHDVMRAILQDMPNAIMIGYHGPAGGSDPFSYFSGNGIISIFGVASWPNATIDRVSGLTSRGVWPALMDSRYSVPATVNINASHTFDPGSRDFVLDIDFTALTNLNGQFMYSVILLEDGIVWFQQGNTTCPGNANYVHNHVVRAMLNGSLGDQIINGVWNQPLNPTSSEYVFSNTNTPSEFSAIIRNNSITKSLHGAIPSPGGSGPDMVWDSCNVVVLVYKSGSPLSSNAEIQQAIEFPLISNSSVTKPELADDMYYISCSLNGPAGWTGEFTTANGTFPFGQTDSVQVASGDSTPVSITVNPNGIGGFGETTLQYTSANNPDLTSSTVFRTITTTGVDVLVVDASEENYGSYVFNSLQNVYEGTYGIVSRDALQASGENLSNFKVVMWSCGNALPVLTQDEETLLQNFLDGGGRLYISGQDIGADIFEPTGQSQFAQSFYNNYLHASYVSNVGSSFFLTGYDGDPISNGLQFVLGDLYNRSPDQISPYDNNATPIFKFATGPNISSIKAIADTNRIIYLGFGLEQVTDGSIRDSIVLRSLNWLTEDIIDAVGNEAGNIPETYSLNQNYPNPFNPSTMISYSIPVQSNVKITVYDMLGKEIATLVDEVKNAGRYEIEFDASRFSSGVYFYKLNTGDYSAVKKMSIVK